MRTHVRRRSNRSRRTLDEGRHAAPDLLVLDGGLVRRPTDGSGDLQADRELVCVTREPATGAAAPVTCVTIERREIERSVSDAVAIGHRPIRQRRCVHVRSGFTDMHVGVNLGRTMRSRYTWSLGTRNAGGEHRQAHREDRDEYRPQLVQRWIASVCDC